MRTEILQMASPAQDQPAPASPGADARPARAQRRPPQDRPPAASPEQHPRPRDRRRTPAPRSKAARRRRAHDSNRGRRARRQSSSRSSTCMNDTEGYGYPKGSRVYKINMQQALLLAIMNARFYQFNLEQVYLAAIPVTQQRFIFGPQFYAGMSPLTTPLTPGVTGGASAGFPSTPGVSTANTFTYATRFSPNGQISTLNMGTVAGVRQAVQHGRPARDGVCQRASFQLRRQESAAADRDLGPADQLCPAPLARRRPGGHPRAAHAGRA